MLPTKTKPKSPGEIAFSGVKRLLSNPLKLLRDLDKLQAEDSLLSFLKLMWPVLEPGRPFIDGWAIRAICDHLEAVSRGQIRRIIFNVPPGFSKSTLVSILFPAWEWGPRNLPWRRYITASHADKLTIEFNRKCRSVIESPIYQELWGDRFQLSSDQNAKMRFDNDRHGFRIATSVQADQRSRADCFQLDDPNPTKDPDSVAKIDAILQYVGEVMPTRIIDPEKSIFMLIQQRVHERDVTGFLLSKSLGYEHLCIPMRWETDHPFKSRTSLGWTDPRTVDGDLAWPERFNEKYIKQTLEPDLSALGGDFAIAGQLQQRPSPRGGGMFKKADFQFVTEVPEGARRVRGWDLAASTDKHSAWTVGVKLAFHKGKVYVEDVVRLQEGPFEVEKAILRAAQTDGFGVIQDLPQDPGQAGKAQVSAIAGLLHGYLAHFSPETGEKEDRCRPFAAQVAAGNVFLVKRPWNDEYLNEACSFPASRWKDQVDATSRAYAKLLLITRSQVPIVGPTFIEG